MCVRACVCVCVRARARVRVRVRVRACLFVVCVCACAFARVCRFVFMSSYWYVHKCGLRVCVCVRIGMYIFFLSTWVLVWLLACRSEDQSALWYICLYMYTSVIRFVEHESLFFRRVCNIRRALRHEMEIRWNHVGQTQPVL